MVHQQLNLFTWHNKWCQASSPTVSTKWVLSKTLRHLIDKLSSHYTLWSGFVFCLKLLHRQHRFIWYIDTATTSSGEDSEYSQSNHPDKVCWFFFYYFAKILRSGGLSGTSSSFPIFKLCLHKRTIFCYQKVTIQSTVKKRLLCIRSYQLGVNCKYIILNRLLHIISARIYCLFKYFREYKASKAPFLTQIVVLNSVRPVL